MMRKIQFFVLIEAILLTMAFITVVAGDFSRLVLLSILFLLFLYYYLGRQRGNFFLVTASILFFLIIMLSSICCCLWSDCCFSLYIQGK